MNKKKVAIVFGGCSTEYYVSSASAASMLREIDKEKFDVVMLGITKEGKWLLTEATPEEIQDGERWLSREDNKTAFITPIKDSKGVLVLENNSYHEIEIDCVFPVIFGYSGEDGKLQALFELCNIPYVGSGVAASASAMDKDITRLYAEKCGVTLPKAVILLEKDYRENGKEACDLDFDYPVFVKPASQGSSVGVVRVDKEEKLCEAIEVAFKYEDKILIEEGIIGKEIKIALLGNEDITIGAICELSVEENAVNDYETKYIKGGSTKKIPAELPTELEEELKRQAVAIYKELNCKGLARCDFFLNKDNKVYFNEINTLPGFSKESIYPVMMDKVGISYQNLITMLINLAFEK